MDVQQVTGKPSQLRDHVAATAGALGGSFALGWAGAALGFGIGVLVTPEPEPTGEFLSGLGEALAPVGYAVIFGILGGLAGAALGCWLALRLLHRPAAGMTAGILAALLLPAFFLLAQVGSALEADWLWIGVFALPAAARAIAVRSSQ